MNNKPTHSIYIIENYLVNNEEKAYFINVGSAWLKDTGTISCKIRPNLAVSGKFILMKNDKATAKKVDSKFM